VFARESLSACVYMRMLVWVLLGFLGGGVLACVCVCVRARLSFRIHTHADKVSTQDVPSPKSARARLHIKRAVGNARSNWELVVTSPTCPRHRLHIGVPSEQYAGDMEIL
jgi:hypothetical protein